MGTGKLERARAGELIDDLDGASSEEEALAELLELVEAYESLPDEGETAKKAREAFILKLKQLPELVSDERVSAFLAERVRSDDITSLDWSDPEEVVSFSETLFSFPVESEEVAEHVRSHVNELLRSQLHRYEKERDHEHMFLLMQYAPTLTTLTDAELFRLRHRTYLYEMRRVLRNRRILYGYLAVQFVLVFVVFPFLFVHAENGQIQETIETVTKKEIPDEPARYYTYVDGLYWSLITAVSVGYGDIVPATTIGRFMSAFLGMLGVTSIGIIAGLVLEWITPRRID